MSSSINPLIPRYAELTWDGLIPESVVFDESFIYLSFTYDSTRAKIQPIQLYISMYCCAGASNGICNDRGTNSGTFHLVFEVWRKTKQRYALSSFNTAIYDAASTSFECPTRFQMNQCRGLYDTKVFDIDFYQTLYNFGLTSVNTTGTIELTPLYQLIILDRNPCNSDIGPLNVGLNLITSLLS